MTGFLFVCFASARDGVCVCFASAHDVFVWLCAGLNEACQPILHYIHYILHVHTRMYALDGRLLAGSSMCMLRWINGSV